MKSEHGTKGTKQITHA